MNNRPAALLRLLLTIPVFILSCQRTTQQSVQWSEPPSGLEQQVLLESNIEWHTLQGQRCRVHYQADTFAARHVSALMRSADFSVAKAIDLLAVDGYQRPIDVFFIDSRDRLFDLIGVQATGYADWRSSSVFLVCNPTWRSFDLHEITHIVSINVWGEPAEPIWWIREGLAVHADGRCRDHSVPDLAAEFLRRGELPSVQDLIYDFQGVGEMPGYLCSGSLVGFLIETYGIDAVKRIWQHGADAIEPELGVTLDVLDARWRDSLRHHHKPIPPAEWEETIDIGCG